ncbi:hypothetical protein F53441_9695 [Fusarium austroafricanum]|uniref:Heterokaryon incompatibility domain-containing protein n=1 Tax=Fusarium austroafricanum TaxID=2364996 RepID=A0A8H4NPY3_9HYPO|nr:hypothetical protein F53441_9695 [Fusarium austroafricanum]
MPPPPLTGPLCTRTSLTNDLRSLGLSLGDTVLVHCSLSSVGWVNGGAEALTQALLEVLTPKGTLVVPTHTCSNSDPSGWVKPPVPEEWWQTIRETRPAFDPRTTPSERMGVLAESVRTWPGAVRSVHPQTSFAAIGAGANFITEGHALDSMLGEQSPLARLEELRAKVLLLGVGFDRCTCFHLAEYRVGSSSKGNTSFAALVGGERQWVTVSDITEMSEDFPALGEDFLGKSDVSTAEFAEAEEKCLPAARTHAPNIHFLRNSAQDGCQLCQIVYQSYLFNSFISWSEDAFPIHLKINSIIPRSEDGPDPLIALSNGVGKIIPSSEWYSELLIIKKETERLVEARYPRISTSVVDLSSDEGVEKAVALAKEWPYGPVDLSQEPIWIDALCINQATTVERSQQVSLMQRIYKEADRVLIWLGPGTVNHGLYLDIIKEEGLSERFSTTLQKNPDLTEQELRWVREIAESRYEVMASPWWNRLWIIQEVCLSSQDPIVACAGRNIGYSRLLQTDGGIFGLDPKSKSFLNVACPNHILPVKDNLRYHFSDGPAWGARNTLLHIVYTSLSPDTMTSGPRDFVYGLLGLITDRERSQILPDCYLSQQEVYQAATKTIWTSGEILPRMRHYYPSNVHLDWPSWVLNFSDWPPQVSGNCAFYVQSLCRQKWKADLQAVDFHGSTLRLKGVVLDAIREVFDFPFTCDRRETSRQIWEGNTAAVLESFQEFYMSLTSCNLEHIGPLLNFKALRQAELLLPIIVDMCWRSDGL